MPPHFVGAFSYGDDRMNRKSELKKLSVTAMLCAVAYLCVFLFRFKVSFLTFDFKDAILAVIAFLYGPLYAFFSSVAVSFIEFLSVSDTGMYGFIMNFLSSAAFAVTCGLFYRYRHTFSGAIFGSAAAVFFMTAVMLVANIFITPFYMGVTRTYVAAMIPKLLLPFNLAKGAVNAAVTMLIYKPITSALKKSGLVASVGRQTDRKKFILLSVVATAILVIFIIIIIFILKGTFVFGKK